MQPTRLLSRLFGTRPLGLLPTLVLLSLPASSHAQTAPFKALDNIESEYTLLGAYPIRPMAVDPVTSDLFTLNVGLSKVLQFRTQDLPTGVPFQTWQVPAQPVSIGIWNETLPGNGGIARRIVVVCRGDHVAVLLDSVTGEVLHLLRLDHEPGDLLIDQARNRAFVSCQGARTVVEINLAASFTRANTFTIVQQEPLRMCFDAQMRLLVAPLCSGNNSAINSTFPTNPSASVVQDLDPFAPIGITLPDEDLLRIDPLQPSLPPALADKGSGTLLFGHNINPVTGKHWQLNVDSHNKDPLRQSEPSVNGDFAANRLTITDLPTQTHTFIDLDRLNLVGGRPDPARTVSLPIDVQFDQAGRGYILGLATDNVMILNSTGSFLDEWNVPDGSGPRAAINGLRIRHGNRGIRVRPAVLPPNTGPFRTEIRDCEIDTNVTGVRVEVAPMMRNEMVIEHNRIHDNIAEESITNGFGVDIVNNGTSSTLVRSNRIWHNVTNVRIQSFTASALLCRERLFSNFIERGLVNVDMLSCASRLTNNTIAFAAPFGPGQVPIGVRYANTAAGGILTLLNNIIFNPGVSGGGAPIQDIQRSGTFVSDLFNNLIEDAGDPAVGTNGNFSAVPTFTGGPDPENLHLVAVTSTPAIWGGANQAFLRAAGTLFDFVPFDPTLTMPVGLAPGIVNVRVDIPVDVDMDPRFIQAPGEVAFTPDLGGDEITVASMTNGAGIDAFGNLRIPPAPGAVTGNVVVNAPTGSFVLLLMSFTIPAGPLNQNVIVQPFGNARLDPPNAVTVLSGVVGAAGTLNLTLNLGPGTIGGLPVDEGDVYVQAVVFAPTGTWLTNRMRVEPNR